MTKNFSYRRNEVTPVNDKEPENRVKKTGQNQPNLTPQLQTLSGILN